MMTLTMLMNRALPILVVASMFLIMSCEPGPVREPEPEVEETEVEPEDPDAHVEDPDPLPPATPHIPRRTFDTARLFNGVTIVAGVETAEGGSATGERVDEESYQLNMELNIRLPAAAQSLEELSELNPGLDHLLPGLAPLLEQAEVSSFYHELYDRKMATMQRNLARLERLVSRENFFDCETVLEMEDPESGRKVLLIQGMMDVDADGSDGDRLIDVEGGYTNFQPFTSYRWRKRTDHPNPFLAGRKAELAELEEEFAIPGLSVERNRELRAGIERLRREIYDLEHNSFLISRADPFIALPHFMFADRDHPYRPGLGDFVVVIHGDTLYPAIYGDVGPNWKIGEGSLRLAQQINPRSTAYARPVSDLEVTYLVFPGSADSERGPPDLDHWWERCRELLEEIGGFEGELFRWEDLTIPADSEEGARMISGAEEEPEETEEAGPES